MNYENELHHALKHNSKDELNCVFEKIYDEYFKLGLFIANQYLPNSDALEIVENTFVDFYFKICKDHECHIKNIKQYLCTAIKNESLKHLKNKNDHVSFDDDKLYNNSQATVFLGEVMLKELSIEEQYILIEHILLDRTFKDIGKELHKSINTVKSIYRRSAQKAKRNLTWIKE